MRAVAILVSLLLINSAVRAEETNKNSQDEIKPGNNKEGDATSIEETLVLGVKTGNFSEITQATQKLVDMPGTLGDPLAAIYSLPGVIYSDGEGGEPAVRGSSPADNLYLVDFMPSGYIFHEFSNSIFHEFILHDFQLHSAGFGPEYSDVTGAVFDITLREPKKIPLMGVIDLSMLRSALFIEGQASENSAFYLSGRQSLFQLFIDEGDEEDGIVIESVPEDNDYQFKYAWTPNRNNTITLSANGASDAAEATFTEESNFVQSNPDFFGYGELLNEFNGQNIVWDKITDNGNLFKLGIGHLDDDFDAFWGDGFYQHSGVTRDTVKFQFGFDTRNSHHISYGGQYQQNTYRYAYDQFLFVCTEFEPDCTLTRRERMLGDIEIDTIESNFFINDSWHINNRFNLDFGALYSQNDYTQDQYLHPRISIRYLAGQNFTLSSSAGSYSRFPDLETVLPDIGNPDLESPTSRHYTLGLTKELNDGWSWNVEAWYKTFENLPLAIAESEADSSRLYANDMSGSAWGLDLLVNKELTSNWYSWIALSYAVSERTNDRSGITSKYQLDTPLIFNWVANYSPTPTFSASWRWTIRSGSAYTPIIGVQQNPWFNDSVLPIYGEPFSDRLPAMNRLDIKFKWYRKLLNRDVEYIIDIVNALDRKNVLKRSLDYDRVTNVNDPVMIEETVSNGILPALSLRLYLD